MGRKAMQARPGGADRARPRPAIPARAPAGPLGTAAAALASATCVQRLRSIQSAIDAGPPRAGATVTGLPPTLRAGVEALSGVSMAAVRVHRGSAEPGRLGAHAFARGTDIHLAPGQERHLPHEAWHVVQQAEGRVAATGSVAGVAINDAAGLEREADRMGAAAARSAPSAAVATRPLAVAAPPAQRVRFSQSNSFYGAALRPESLPRDIVAALISRNRGRAEAQWYQIALTDQARHWVDQHGRVPSPAGGSIYVEVDAGDWERLGTRDVPSIEIDAMPPASFDQQGALMTRLDQLFAGFIQQHRGQPLRIASFRFGRHGGGPLETEQVAKPIEPLVASSITAAFLDQQPPDLRQAVQANVHQTLLSAGQFQWIAANWPQISATHDVYVDVDYYPNRLPDRGGLLHKDSVSETLFVNLTYNNQNEGIAPEYIVDQQGHAPFENDLPQPARDLILTKRWQNVLDDGSIKGLALPARGRVSFVDPVIWHATPLYGHRVPDIGLPDQWTGSYEDLRTFIRQSRHTEGSKNAALAVLGNDQGQLTAQQARQLLRQPTIFGSGSLAGTQPVDTTGHVRRPRARSIDLNQHPGRLQQLQQQSAQPRSFIRTWVILRRRPPPPPPPVAGPLDAMVE